MRQIVLHVFGGASWRLGCEAPQSFGWLRAGFELDDRSDSFTQTLRGSARYPELRDEERKDLSGRTRTLSERLAGPGFGVIPVAFERPVRSHHGTVGNLNPFAPSQHRRTNHPTVGQARFTLTDRHKKPRRPTRQVCFDGCDNTTAFVLAEEIGRAHV